MSTPKFRPYNADRYSQTAATTGTGTAISFHDCRQTSWEVQGTGVISAGTVKIETNDIAQDYSGTWHELDSIDASTLTGGAVYHNTYPGPLGWVRSRISSNITGGGNVSTPLNGMLG